MNSPRPKPLTSSSAEGAGDELAPLTAFAIYGPRTSFSRKLMVTRAYSPLSSSVGLPPRVAGGLFVGQCAGNIIMQAGNFRLWRGDLEVYLGDA